MLAKNIFIFFAASTSRRTLANIQASSTKDLMKGSLYELFVVVFFSLAIKSPMQLYFVGSE